MEPPAVTSDQAKSRHALAFRYPEPEEVPKTEEEENDSFFELTLDEFKALYRDMQRQKEIDDKLLPRSKREEEQKKLRPAPYVYKAAVVRIEFPDRTILQGEFQPNETIGDVKAFVRSHIKEPGTCFNLFTSPPKVILQDECQLDDLQLVPRAKLYIGIQNGGSCEFLPGQTAVVSFDSAQDALEVIRRPTSEVQPGPSKSEPKTAETTSSSDGRQPPKKVPKWFKTNKK